MADKAPNEEGSQCDSTLDQLLQRQDQTNQEATVSLSNSGASMAEPSSEYLTLTTSNPWTAFNVSSPLNSDLQTAINGLYRTSQPPPLYLLTNPLAEFPWLLEDQTIESHQRGDSRWACNLDSHDPDQRCSTHNSLSTSHGDQLRGDILERTGVGNSGPPLLSQSMWRDSIKEEPASSLTSAGSPARSSKVARKEFQGHGTPRGNYGSSSKSDAEPVPRFDRTTSSEELSIPSHSPVQFGGSSQSPFPRSQNYWPTSVSPRLSEAIQGAGGSVTTSAGTSNTSLSSESTSNAGDEDEVEKEVSTTGSEGTSTGKRKMSEASASGEAGGTDPKKSEPKNKPRKRGGAKRLREPRYAIKTRTDMDVLDDGFKWRKYGQKAVKNSPHPRNYYRCTTPLCPVRKRVERSKEDAGLVITTYEGTHSHQTPSFHRPGGGYFGDRPQVGGGLFLNPGQSPLGSGSSLLPLPPGFDLPSLQQAAELRNPRGLQLNQNFQGSNPRQQLNPMVRGPFGFPGQDSIFRASQLLGLQDPAFDPIKQEQFHFNAQPSDFISRNIPNLSQLPIQQQFEQPGSSLAGSGPGPAQSPDRPISENDSMQRSGSGIIPQISSPLLRGLNFPNLPSSHMGPASSSSTLYEPDSSSLTMSRGQLRHEPLVGGSSSRIDQSLETLIRRPQLSLESEPSDRSIGGSHGLGSGMDQRTRTGLQRTVLPTMQAQVQQTRPGIERNSPSEQASEAVVVVPPDVAFGEGLLQDMVRHGTPKASRS
ncbi:uncharacterized protein [Physcomitrium patens]|uniref:WRKY domain-containing protein n=1 Tax=Physcomitrium patens TaxID=3218 RepID=A0A2K1KWX2_PHYPA|nr:uncharacterized protein LOC112280083 [Physcomitrium patens]XP_024370870.1 uncharacterized protein LOC112280083 [Physcomitrium patens]XP_024370871.1 uncharacterized protein LOC112280083 [Physcomitrium patens]PNR58297.1 hypothetical protein PHYPA_005292 [Physcomitrium patens]|eukprot:XP_024370869.1 uncharacterized protein LOC112280083 [Physcomitrella patens]